jgi:hypothetical protein
VYNTKDPIASIQEHEELQQIIKVILNSPLENLTLAILEEKQVYQIEKCYWV